MSIDPPARPDPAAPRDHLGLAIGAILGACFALSLGDALIKQQSANFVIWQIFLMRSLIALPFLIYLARLQGCALPLWPVAPGWTLLRSLMLVSMWIFYFAALPQVQLAVAAAAYYTLPLFITLLAALLLGEKIEPRGRVALLLGFSGTLLVLQPQADDFNAWALLPVLAALCYAGAMIMTRSKCRHERPTVLSLWLNLCFIGVGGFALLLLQVLELDPETMALNPFLLGNWTPMWLAEWRMLAILALALVVGSIGAAFAYQNGPAAVIAIFDFSYVALAALWGYILFAEIPAPWVALGIGLIIVSGALASARKPHQA